MNTAETAGHVLEACGGSENIDGNAVCMTRLRLQLHDRSLVDTKAIEGLHGVLGVRMRGDNGVEVVFGPAIVDAIAAEFSRLSDLPMERKTAKAITRLTANGPMTQDHLHSTRRYGGDSAHADKEAPSRSQAEDMDALRKLLETPSALTTHPSTRAVAPKPVNEVSESAKPGMPTKVFIEDAPVSENGPRILVVNGPNLNLLGLREPDIYGRKTYADLVELVERCGQALGFSDVECFQSNHEGAIVDKIQEAVTGFDGIVINPAAYTHTSVAILDAIKAVGVPTVEVHISDVTKREDFRQKSYVRPACIATVMGEGLAGYTHAMTILRDHLEQKGDSAA